MPQQLKTLFLIPDDIGRKAVASCQLSVVSCQLLPPITNNKQPITND